MKEVEIPGGTAFFREKGKDEIPGRSVKLIRAAATAAGSQFAEFPELFEGQRPGESDEDRDARLEARLQGMTLSTEQAMAWDDMREATAVALIASWTLDKPLPTYKTIGDLDEELYEAILTAVGGMSAAELEVNFDLSDPSHPDYKETPTTASDGSDGLSEAQVPSESTTTPSTDGGPISGESSSPEPLSTIGSF
jgi:hypothetical protein